MTPGDSFGLPLHGEHYDLLLAVYELQRDDDAFPSTEDVGLRLREIYQRAGGPYAWFASAPWHGTSPMGPELRDAGLLDVEVGIATFHASGTPTPAVQMYWLGLTSAGRAALLDHLDSPGPRGW